MLLDKYNINLFEINSKQSFRKNPLNQNKRNNNDETNISPDKSNMNGVVILLTCIIVCVTGHDIELPCDEYKGQELLYEGLYCTVDGVHLTHDDIFNCDVYPYHRHLIKVIKFSSCRTPSIPHMLFQFMENIREFDISFSELESVRLGDFRKADNLLYFTAAHNKLSELTAGIFVGAPNISVIDFSYNHISKVNAYAFSAATLVSRLHLSHNMIAVLDKQTFANLTSLDELHLDNNQIEVIDIELFLHNELMARLSLNNNRIVQLHCNILSHLRYLNQIDVSVNRLSAFNTSCLSDTYLDLYISDNHLESLTLRKVVSVIAARNQIKSLHIADEVSNLKKLKLANNSLTNVSGIFEQLTSLETLDLSYNFVGKLDIATFAKLTNLEHLILSHTNLSNINFGTFFHQKELKTLDISYNNLNKINFDIFLPYLKNLESLYLDGNNLTEMEGLTNSLFPQLSILSISNNNFNCTYLAKLLRTLKWEELGLNIDPDLVHSNETHINGIACDHPANDSQTSITYNRIHNDNNDHQYNIHKAIVAILDPSNTNYTTKSDNSALDELNKLRNTHALMEYREHLLESHLLAMKYLLAFICLICLVYLAFKFVMVFRANRRLEFDVKGACHGIYLHDGDKRSDIYQSTVTMNTLQTNIAY